METQLNQQRNRNALGRGLSSLIPSPATPPLGSAGEPATLLQISVDDLLPGDGQPRRNFDAQALAELASSISEHGILQPLIVRRRVGGQHEIVAGERRWRASKIAGLEKVPCVVTNLPDQAALTVALVENIQREDLNAIEEAESYRRLAEEIGLTQEQIAKAVGKDRTTVTNALRLLKLPPATRELVIERRMSMGHARALLSLRDGDLIQQIADQIAEEGISVRKTEELVQEKLRDKGTKPMRLQKPSVEERDIRRQLENLLGTKIDLRYQGGKGSIIVHFSSVDQLNGILSQLGLGA